MKKDKSNLEKEEFIRLSGNYKLPWWAYIPSMIISLIAIVISLVKQ